MAAEEKTRGHKPINDTESRNALIALASGTLQKSHPPREALSAYAPTCELLLNWISDERFGAQSSYPELADYQYQALSHLTRKMAPIVEPELTKRGLHAPGYLWTRITETYKDSETTDDGEFEYTAPDPLGMQETILLYTRIHHPAEDEDRTASIVLADVEWGNIFDIWSDVLEKVSKHETKDETIILARELLQLTDVIIADADDYRNRIDMISRMQREP